MLLCVCIYICQSGLFLTNQSKGCLRKQTDEASQHHVQAEILRRDILAVDRWSPVLVAVQCYKSSIAVSHSQRINTRIHLRMPLKLSRVCALNTLEQLCLHTLFAFIHKAFFSTVCQEISVSYTMTGVSDDAGFHNQKELFQGFFPFPHSCFIFYYLIIFCQNGFSPSQRNVMQYFGCVQR